MQINTKFSKVKTFIVTSKVITFYIYTGISIVDSGCISSTESELRPFSRSFICQKQKKVAWYKVWRVGGYGIVTILSLLDQTKQILCANALNAKKNINTDFTSLLFHCDDCCLVFGSQTYTHVSSSPVMILDVKLESPATTSQGCIQTSTRWFR